MHHVLGAGKFKPWLPACLLLAVCLTAACTPAPSLEVSLTPVPQMAGTVYIDGAVSSPGYYGYRSQDTLANLIGAAGGALGQSDGSLKLHVVTGTTTGAQKVNLNRAEAWLLEALPGVGEVTAERIIAYRMQQGAFHNISELTLIEGIGPGTYADIKDLVTVED
jgi:competence protein ComEA